MTAEAPEKLQAQLDSARLKAKLLAAEARVSVLSRHKKRAELRESSEQWEWLGGWQDIIDRMQAGSTGMDFALPISTASDRRYGANWPFWRTWAEHARLRASARILHGTSSQAIGLMGGLCGYVVGQGFTWHAKDRPMQETGVAPVPGLAAAVQAAIDEFLDENLYGELEQELFIRTRRDGDSFEELWPQQDGMLLVNCVDPEQIVEPMIGQHDYTMDTASFGILTAPHDHTRPVAYWKALDGFTDHGEEVAAYSERMPLMPGVPSIVHAKCNVDRNIKRGLTDFSFDTYDGFKSAARLAENMAEGAAIQAAIALVMEHEGSSVSQISNFVDGMADRTEGGLNGTRVPSRRYQKGTREDIPAGRKYVQPPFMANAEKAVAVLNTVLTAAGLRWNAPSWLSAGDTGSHNYATALVAESPFTRKCEQEQGFCLKRRLKTVKAAVRCRCDAGTLVFGGRAWSWLEVKALIDISGEPPRLQVRNELEVAKEAQIYVGIGVKSPQMVSQELGVDAEQVMEDTLQRMAMMPAPEEEGGEGGEKKGKGKKKGGKKDDVDDDKVESEQSPKRYNEAQA